MKKLSIKNIVLSSLLFCFLIQPQLLLGQWFYSLYLEQEYNSNPFGLPSSEDDQISRISMGLQKDWQKVSAQYFGSYHTYYHNFERSFYWQQFYLRGGDSTSWSLLAENRLDRSDYRIYNYLSVRGGINHSEAIKNFLWRLSGGITLNNFLELPDLDNLLFSINTSLQRSFITRTSFIGTVALNYKYYLKKIATVDSAELFLPSLSQLYQGGSHGPGHSGPGTGGGYDLYVPDNEQQGLAQLLITLRLAQSLTSYTGLAIQYQSRLNFNEYDRSVTGLIYGYASESQIFDDPMGYGSQMWGIELTQLLPHQISIKTAGYYQEKNYVSQGIYSDVLNFNQSILRNDFFRTIWGSLEKRFSLGEASLALQIHYQWINNSSNSYWYDYVSQFVALGIQADL